MVNLKRRHVLRGVALTALSLSFLILMTSCSSLIKLYQSLESNSTRVTESDEPDPDYSYETLAPTGSYTSETEDDRKLDAGYIKSLVVYSVWYDVTTGNPAKYDSIKSEKAFALKGVFYFSSPVTAEFEAKLLNGNETVLKKTFKVNKDVTCNADFSAGLEGLGTFEPGKYTVVLLFDGEEVAKTDVLRVE